MEAFYEAAADELLFIIAKQNTGLFAERLFQEFEKRVGVTLENFVGIDGHEFVRSSPALSAAHVQNLDGSQSLVYLNNYTYANQTIDLFRSQADGEYCEILLIKACQLIEDKDLNLAYCDNTENTALHYLAAMPGPNTSHLVRLVLEAEGKELALKTNINGQNILHIIAGRLRARKDDDGDLVFGNDRVEAMEWTVKDRKAVLDVLNEKLSFTELSHLVNAQDEFGDTAMHEWALSASETATFANSEVTIGQYLLDVGAKLRLPNYSGHIPLHYAPEAVVFEFLVENCNASHVRNDFDETPLMFMIKSIIKQTLSRSVNLTEYPEIPSEFLERLNPKPIEVFTLTPVIKLLQGFDWSDEVWDTIEIPDIDGTFIFDLVLLSIKIASYDFFIHLEDPGRLVGKLRFRLFARELVSLLESIIATPNSTRHQDKEVLHTLLNLDPNIPELNRDSTSIVSCLDMLFRKGSDMNCVDTDGLTPLDIAYKYYKIRPIFYQKIIEKLLKCGARRSAKSFKRKLTSSCPVRHLPNAKDLTETTGMEDNVTVVGKFRYFNDKPIGSGAFSSVFLAIKDENLDEGSDTMHCRCFALKRIEKAKINQQEINREAKTLISLSNESANVVKYYGVEHSVDSYFQYLCLELMDGDLEQFIGNKSRILAKKENEFKAVRDIIRGVEFLHWNNFIHRDIKPGNILYTMCTTQPGLQFKIADFGLTKDLLTSSTMTLEGGIAIAPGTRCWMAPELISMKTTGHNKKTDLFSLGLVLYYLITVGKHPFATEMVEPSHVIEKRIVDVQIRTDQVLQPEARSFLDQLLHRNPSRRPPVERLCQHPFLWSARKKIEFLKAVGSQPEVVTSTGSTLEQKLQMTATGRQVSVTTWNRICPLLFNRMRMDRKKGKVKKYRTTKMTDLLRFIRNAYAHQEQRWFQPELNFDSNDNVFLREYPSLVLDVFAIVQQLGYEKRSSICQALKQEQKSPAKLTIDGSLITI